MRNERRRVFQPFLQCHWGLADLEKFKPEWSTGHCLRKQHQDGTSLNEIHVTSKLPPGFCFLTLFIEKSCHFVAFEVPELSSCVRVGVFQSIDLDVGIAVSIGCLVIGQHKSDSMCFCFLCMYVLFGWVSVF